MHSKNLLYVALFLAVVTVTFAQEGTDNLQADKRYLKCHGDSEICNTTNCCNTNYTCQPSSPAVGTKQLYAGEMRCLPPGSAGKNVPFPANTCHLPLEICKNNKCCYNDRDGEEYVCAPYDPQYEPHKPALFPCEYRCEYKANQTMPVMPQEMCMANMTASSGESDM